jgi:hypothetical protein
VNRSSLFPFTNLILYNLNNFGARRPLIYTLFLVTTRPKVIREMSKAPQRIERQTGSKVIRHRIEGCGDPSYYTPYFYTPQGLKLLGRWAKPINTIFRLKGLKELGRWASSSTKVIEFLPSNTQQGSIQELRNG